jgi:transposase InsO family protein
VAIRQDFVRLAVQGDLSMRELCRRFRISAPTGYKWLRRYERDGAAGLEDGSHRPRQQPRHSSAELEQRVVAVRSRHPAWGGRKIRKLLEQAGQLTLPSASTVSAILRRHKLLDPRQQAASQTWLRFEHDRPNELWQMDFKGHFAIDQGRCHPLTVLDDHSRFNLGLRACGNELESTTREQLAAIFRVYGLPRRTLADNGPPFGTSGEEAYSTLQVWLMRLGVELCHGRPCHPQTQGKEERFHRTLKLEVLRNREFHSLAQVQGEFDSWREVYNHQRPHDALGLAVPAARYQPSPRPFPESLPPLEYACDLTVRKVAGHGAISFQGRTFHIGKAFLGLPVGLRATTTDGLFQVLFAATEIRRIDLRRDIDHV